MFHDFLRKYDPTERGRLVGLITGGGFSFYNLLTQCGMSRLVEALYSPYSVSALGDFVGANAPLRVDDAGHCNEDATISYLYSIENLFCSSFSFRYFVINSALITNRYRQGDNRAWLGVAYKGKIRTKLVNLPKKYSDPAVYAGLTKDHLDSIRRIEDETVTKHLLEFLLEGD